MSQEGVHPRLESQGVKKACERISLFDADPRNPGLSPSDALLPLHSQNQKCAKSNAIGEGFWKWCEGMT
jgi:hypothetical protein